MRCHDRWRRCRGAGARPTAALACCSRVRSSSRACHRRSPRSCTSCCSSGMLCSSAAQVQQQLTTAGFSSTSRSRCRRSSAELHRLHRNTSRAPRFDARRALHGPCKLSSLDLPLQHPLGRRTSSFNLFTLVRYGELAATIRTRRGTLDLELGGCDACGMQEQIYPRFSLSATLQARRAARGLPRDAAPRPMPSHLTLLPSFPSLLPFTPSLAPGVGVGGCGLGGRAGGVVLELTGISSTSSSLDARLTLALVLARRSLDPVTSTQRARLW